MKNLKIYPDAYRVYKDDREVDLTNREFELLLFLAQNPNIVFSKEKLFDRVWGMDAVGDMATVAVHINKLQGENRRSSVRPQTDPDSMGRRLSVSDYIIAGTYNLINNAAMMVERGLAALFVSILG